MSFSFWVNKALMYPQIFLKHYELSIFLMDVKLN